MTQDKETSEHLTFEKWMKRVDSYIAAKLMGFTSSDLADVCYHDNYESGMTAYDQAIDVIENEADDMGLSIDFLL